MQWATASWTFYYVIGERKIGENIFNKILLMQYFSVYKSFTYLNKIRKIQAWYSQKGIYLWPSTYMQDKREIPAIVNEKIVISVKIFTLSLGVPHF